MIVKDKPPDWFNVEYSKSLHLPDLNNYTKEDININFGKKIYNDTFNEHYKFNNNDEIKNTFNFIHLEDNSDKIKNKLIEEKNKILKKTKDEKTIKSINSKFTNKINNIKTVTICHKFRIYPDENQKNIINEWFCEALEIYNKCVDIHNRDFTYFNKGYMSAKIEIFNLMNRNFKCPYDSRTNVIAKFCSNLKSAKTNYNNGNIEKFIMKPQNNLTAQNLYIPKSSINNKTFFPTHLGIIRGVHEYFTNNNINIDNICDSFIRYDKIHKKYYFIVPYCRNMKNIIDRKKVVNIDPGKSTPFTYFSQDGFGCLGKNIRKKILEEQKYIKKNQSILSKNINKDGNKLKNKNYIKRKIQKHYDNIKNYVKEFHNKVALYLVKNYDIILIPEFKTKSMILNNDSYKWEINMNPNISIDKEELAKIMKEKDITNINEMLNLFSKIEKKAINVEVKDKPEIEQLTIKCLEENIKKSKDDNFINMTKDLIDIKRLHRNFTEKYNDVNNKIKQKIREIEKKKIKNIENIARTIISNNEKQFSETINSINKEMFNFLSKELNYCEDEIKKYFDTITKEQEEKLKKEEREKNVKKLIELLKENEQKDEIKEEIEKIKKEKSDNRKQLFKLLKEKYGEEVMKMYRKKINKRSVLNKRVKFVLQMLSHYSFRQHLKNKCLEYGCHLEIVTEEYTSKTCTNCGTIGNNFTKRVKCCTNCHYKIDRDINGARNILIKNLDKIIC